MPADFTENLVNEIIADLTPREKSIIANMDFDDIEILEATLHRYTEGKGDPINDTKGTVRRVWAILYESHRLRVVE